MVQPQLNVINMVWEGGVSSATQVMVGWWAVVSRMGRGGGMGILVLFSNRND